MHRKDEKGEKKKTEESEASIKHKAAAHDEILSCCVFRFVAFIRVHCIECSENRFFHIFGWKYTRDSTMSSLLEEREKARWWLGDKRHHLYMSTYTHCTNTHILRRTSSKSATFSYFTTYQIGIYGVYNILIWKANYYFALWFFHLSCMLPCIFLFVPCSRSIFHWIVTTVYTVLDLCSGSISISVSISGPCLYYHFVCRYIHTHIFGSSVWNFILSRERIFSRRQTNAMPYLIVKIVYNMYMVASCTCFGNGCCLTVCNINSMTKWEFPYGISGWWWWS